MRYQKINVAVWNQPRFQRLSLEGKILYFYFRTGQHSNLMGLYTFRMGYGPDDTGLSKKSFDSSFQELLDAEFIQYDLNSSTIYIPSHLEENPLTNPNQIKSILNLFLTMPECPYITILWEVLPKGLTKDFDKDFDKSFRNLYSVAVSCKLNTVTVTEENTAPKSSISRLEYGEFKNVKLSSDEFQKLIDGIGTDRTKVLIRELSEGIASKGYKYKNHYATILSWHRRKGSISGNLFPQRKSAVDLAKEMIEEANNERSQG